MPPKNSKSGLAINLGAAVAAGLKKALYNKAKVGLSNWARTTLKTKKAVLSKNKTKRAAKGVGLMRVAKGEGVETSFVLENPPSEPVKVMKKINPQNNLLKQNGMYQAWDVGRQSALTIASAFTQADFQNILANLPPRDLSANANRRFLVDNYKSEVTFANGTNATCYVYVYDIMCKTDVDAADFTAGIGDPATAWLNGEIQQGNATGYHVIGSDPSKIDLFKQHYKILNVTKHFMKPGDIHKHHININYNKIMNEARINNSNRYAGVSYSTMLVAHGVPAQDDSAVPVVSTTAGVINITFTQKFQYRYALDNQQNSVAITPLLLQPATLEIVQEDGDIDVVTNA